MDAVSSAHAAALWVGLHVLLLLILSVMVVRLRQKHRVSLGDDGIPELARAIRAFGNATEYVPAGLIALAVLVGGWVLLSRALGREIQPGFMGDVLKSAQADGALMCGQWPTFSINASVASGSVRTR